METLWVIPYPKKIGDCISMYKQSIVAIACMLLACSFASYLSFPPHFIVMYSTAAGQSFQPAASVTAASNAKREPVDFA